MTYSNIDRVIFSGCGNSQLQLNFKLKTNFKFSNFLLNLCGSKNKVKRRERNDKNN